MDKPSEQALNSAHEKKRGKERDSKSAEDCDIGVHDYGAGGKREQLAGLWSIPSKEVVGLDPDRLLTNEYCKKPEVGEGSDKEQAGDLIDKVMSSGPPLLNVSKPRRIF